MSKFTKEDIFRIVDEEDVAFIRLQFTDIFGASKNLAITTSQLESALNNECLFDGVSVKGFVDSDESDMYLYPDLDTFEIYPWRPQAGKVARMYCDVYTTERKPFAGDPRYVLKKVMAQAKEMGLEFKIDPELEFFLFDCDDHGHPTTNTYETAGYFDVAPSDQGENVRRDIILNLENMNFEMSSSHHEIAPAQHEVDFKEDDAQKIADMIQTFRMAVKTIAKKHGLYATFMPKPKEGVNGSGMHINIKAFDDKGRNVFKSADGKDISETAQMFIGGVLDHIKGITLVTNPLVNSYKRLVPGYDAPVSISWSSHSANRSALVRIPSQKGDNTQIELRNPDAACNPYLAIALILAAGLDGIKHHTLADMNLANGQHEGDLLPQTLGEAIEAFERDDFVKEVLGESITKTYLESKKKEWSSFRSCVTQWEIDHYLNQF